MFYYKYIFLIHGPRTRWNSVWVLICISSGSSGRTVDALEVNESKYGAQFDDLFHSQRQHIRLYIVILLFHSLDVPPSHLHLVCASSHFAQNTTCRNLCFEREKWRRRSNRAFEFFVNHFQPEEPAICRPNERSSFQFLTEWRIML